MTRDDHEARYWRRKERLVLVACVIAILGILVMAKVNDIRVNEVIGQLREVEANKVYCDPPYKDTLGYGGTEQFDSTEFWKTARQWSENGATVVVSESNAPTGWKALAVRERKAALRIATREENDTRREVLWVLESQVA